MKKIGIRILGCMALLSMVGCGRIEGASVQDLSNTKDAIVELIRCHCKRKYYRNRICVY